MIKGFKTTPGLRFSRMMRKFGFSGPMAEIYHPRDSKSYKVWRARVFKKYGSTCSICGSRQATAAHHLVTFSKNPDMRYRVENGRPVCAGCHRRTKSYGIRVAPEKEKVNGR